MTTPEEQLPVFLRRRNGRLELVLHCTWCQDYDLCAQKFWLRYGAAMEGSAPRAALNYGGAVHEALRLRYANDWRQLPLEEIEAIQLDALQGWFDASPNPADDYRNCGRAQDLIRAYNEHYPAHDWQVLGVEEEFEVEVGAVELDSTERSLVAANRLGLTTGRVPVYLAGRKDLIVAWHDGVWIVDHKTAQDWGRGDSNSHLDEGRMSFQFRGYAWAEREGRRNPQSCPVPPNVYIDKTARVVLPVLGCVGNYLVSRRPYATDNGAKKSSVPRNQFHQECYPFSNAALDEWRDEFLGIAQEVLANWQRGSWRRHRSACGHWGRCEFYDYCNAEPAARDAILSSSEFREKTFDREL